MRKITLLAVLTLFAMSTKCKAQLTVDNFGRVGIGTSTTLSQLSVGGSSSGYYTYINTQGDKSGMFLLNNGHTGLYIDNKHSASYGATGISIMGTGASSGPNSYGIMATTGMSSTQNAAICGMMPGIPSGHSTTNPHMTAILGSSGMSTNMLHSGTYAGYFLGSVRVTGPTYAYILSPSSITSTSQISPITETSSGESVSKKLMNLNAIKVINEEQPLLLKVDSTVRENLLEAGYDAPEYVESDDKPLASTRYEIDHEQLSKIFPELISRDDDGNYCTNYIEMIPLLLQSIKELNAKIEMLEDKLNSK